MILKSTNRFFTKHIQKGQKIDTRYVYKDQSTPRLVNARNIIYFSQYEQLVDNIDKIVYKTRKYLGDKFFYWFMRNTIAKQFVAGNTLDEVRPKVEQFGKKDIQIITYYMAEYEEGVNNEQFYEYNTQEYIRSLLIKESKYCKFYSIAIKATAFFDYDTLKKANEFQNYLDSIFLECKKQKQDSKYGITISKEDFKQQCKQMLNFEFSDKQFEDFYKLIKLTDDQTQLHYFEYRLNMSYINLYNPEIEKNYIFQQIYNFDEKEKREIQNAVKRVKRILEESKKQEKVKPILMDAEQTYLQNAISVLTEQFQITENNEEKIVMMNTFQCYLKNTTFRTDVEVAKVNYFGDKYPVAFKIVRGAYKKEEDKIAKEQNKESPVFQQKHETDECYDKIAEKLLDKLKKNSIIIIATHNNDSVYKLMKNIKEKKEIQKNIYFASLYGLNDYLTFQTLFEGYNTIKYLSYGEEKIQIPFLLRRSIECKEIMKRSKLELSLLDSEIWNRIKDKLRKNEKEEDRKEK